MFELNPEVRKMMREHRAEYQAEMDREYAEGIAEEIGESVAEVRGTDDVAAWGPSHNYWMVAVMIIGREETIRIATTAAARVMAEKEGF